MPNTLPNSNPLSYLGVQAENPPNLVRESRSPLTTDTSGGSGPFPLGTIWLDIPAKIIYALVASEANVAIWSVLGGSVINGGFPITSFVVGPLGEAGYQTIQSALDAANEVGGGMVYLQPGTFTEDLTFFDNTQLVSVGYEDAGQTILTGVHTPPLSGSIAIRGIQLNSPSSLFFSTAAGSTNISITESTFGVADGWVFDLLNWTGTFNINNCGSQLSTEDGVVNNTGGSDVFTNNCQVGAGTTRTFNTSGDVRLDLTFLNCPGSISAGAIFINFALFSQTLTISGTATGSIVLGDFFTGADAALVMNSSGDVSMANTSINTSNDPAIDGTGVGTLLMDQITFLDNGNIAGALTVDFGGNNLFGPMEIHGNLVLADPATQFQMEGGAATDFIGTATLVMGTVTVMNTNIAANDQIFLQHVTDNGSTALGTLVYTILPGTSFNIRAADAGGPAVTEVSDLSTVSYHIVRLL